MSETNETEDSGRCTGHCCEKFYLPYSPERFARAAQLDKRRELLRGSGGTFAAQKALAIAATENPVLWNLRVFLDRTNPWNEFLQAPDQDVVDATPIANIHFDSSAVDGRASRIEGRSLRWSRTYMPARQDQGPLPRMPRRPIYKRCVHTRCARACALPTWKARTGYGVRLLADTLTQQASSYVRGKVCSPRKPNCQAGHRAAATAIGRSCRFSTPDSEKPTRPQCGPVAQLSSLVPCRQLEVWAWAYKDQPGEVRKHTRTRKALLCAKQPEPYQTL